jgi:hypothetical protein
MLRLFKTFTTRLTHCLQRWLYSPINDTTKVLSPSDQDRLLAAIETAKFHKDRLYHFQENTVRRYCRIWRLIHLGER